jgi:opacity protein-like surface antigen
MKKISLVICAAVVAGFSVASRAAVVFKPQVEYWLATDAYQKLRADYAGKAGSPGYDESAKVSGGYGARFGAFLPSSVENLQFGGSLGYIVGPEGKFHQGGTTWYDDYTCKSRFVRALLEAHATLPVSGAHKIGFNAGVGIAQGRLKKEEKFDFGLGARSETNGQTFNGLTYEGGVSYIHAGEKLGLEVGILFAGFPRMGTNSDRNFWETFDWNPLGLRLAVTF